MNPSDLNRAEYRIRQAMDAVNELPPSREVSMVKTKLDEARLWLVDARRHIDA